MNGNEIRIEIDKNNKKIQRILNSFILNNEIKNLMKANDKLRAQCEHNFIDGVCEYCDAFEGQIYD